MLDELERLEQAATPGPWTVKERGEILYVEPGRNPLWQYVCQVGATEVPMVQSDAALIAAARNALPALLRVARAAQTLLDQVPSAIDDPELDEAREALEAALAALRAEGREDNHA